MGLLFNMLFRYAIGFLRNRKTLNFMAVVTFCSDFGAQENKICHSFHFFPFYLPWSDGTGYHDLSFLNVEFQQNMAQPLEQWNRDCPAAQRQRLCAVAAGETHPLVWSPCNPRDSQESSPTPQFKSINSLVLSFLCSPALTSIHDYCKNRSLETRWTFVSKVMSLLLICCLGLS